MSAAVGMLCKIVPSRNSTSRIAGRFCGVRQAYIVILNAMRFEQWRQLATLGLGIDRKAADI